MKKQSLKKWAVLGLVTLGLTTSGTALRHLKQSTIGERLYTGNMVEQQEFGLIQKFKAIFINIVQLQTVFGLDGKVGVL